ASPSSSAGTLTSRSTRRWSTATSTPASTSFPASAISATGSTVPFNIVVSRFEDPMTTRDERWQTALTSIAPDKILVRGYCLDEMMGRLTFAEAVYLLLMGELPTPSIGRMFDAI